MDHTSTLLQAIEVLKPELPSLIGDNWNQFDPKLIAYLRELGIEPSQELAIYAQILTLFKQYPQAHKRLMVTLAQIESLGTRGIVDILARLLSSEAEVVRYADIVCPSRVWKETSRISIVVRLTTQPTGYSPDTAELIMLKGLPVRVCVEAARFNLLNEPEQEIIIPSNTDSLPVVFDLHPREVGQTRINLDFFQNGNPLGTVSVPVEVTSYEVSATAEPRPRQSLLIDTHATPPDLMLYISHDRSHNPQTLSFTLLRAGEVGRSFPSIFLRGDLEVYTARLYQGLDTLTAGLDPSPKKALRHPQTLPAADVDRHLKLIGQNLWKDLIPQELKTIYATERANWHNKTLLIVSDEPYIPWELVWPYDDKSGAWLATEREDQDPWCLSMYLTRWLRRDTQGNGHEAPSVYLKLHSLACLAPTDSGLFAAQREQAFLMKVIAQYNIANVSPAHSTWSEVVNLLEEGKYDWVHVATHGNFYPDTPDSDSAIWLQDMRPITPNTIVGAQIEGHIKQHRPAFVFNACHSGRQGWTLTRLGGWANRLISAGAGLVLAPLWTVTDSLAMVFAQTFYEELLAGKTVAEAVRQGRLAARCSGDPSWLAYCIYAHPNARLATPASEDIANGAETANK